MKTLLVDADIAIFQFAAVNQGVFEWDEETESEVTDLEKAVFDLEGFINALIHRTKADGAIFCFSSSPCFRYSILPTYKHNRKGKERPKLLQDLREHIMDNYPYKVKPELEADDVIGILATLHPNRYIIASIDKDLLQIPGRHYNWKEDRHRTITQEEADWFFYRQVLTGDPTDGYKGCPGVGVKRAERVLEGACRGNLWPVIIQTYEGKGLSETDALQQARVARILREGDYDFRSKKPALWTPAV